MDRPLTSLAIDLLKPNTWLAPMWAYMCGLGSPGNSIVERWPVAVLGICISGPLVCGTSQIVSAWFDHQGDDINETVHFIRSGRAPDCLGICIAGIFALLSLFLAATIGLAVLSSAVLGLALAWAYSAPPLRLKSNGWWGNATMAISHGGLPWFSGAAIMAGGLPDERVLVLALLYTVGAYGMMMLNDFKSLEGDTKSGVASLPVQLGVERAARLACYMMVVPQMIVCIFLQLWGYPLQAMVVALLLTAQGLLMPRMLVDPQRQASWYNSTGGPLYVLGMPVAALSFRLGLGGAT